MANHGVFVTERGTAVTSPVEVPSGVAFAIGCAPIQAADHPATPGVPILCHSWDEAVDALGYSDTWTSYNLCEVMYSHFHLYSAQPIIFLNLLDPATMSSAVTSAAKAVSGHKIYLEINAIDDENLVVKKGNTTLVKGTDYVTYYTFDVKGTGNSLTIELLATGAAYSEASLDVAYNKVTPATVNTSAVITGIEKVELCMTTLGVVPDVLLAPGYSETPSVAAALAAKAASINGMFRAKALVDIPTSTATVYTEAVTEKNSSALTDENMIVCWPMVKLAGKKYHMSTHLAGIIAVTDAEYGAPYASPSNHTMQIDSMVLASGAEVLMTLAHANQLNANGIVTALNFMGGYVAWGNYTACYPGSTDVKDYFIPVSRMFDWVANTLITTFWGRLDIPMTRRMVDSVIDTANIWMNGLTGSGYILGGRVEMLESENNAANLMAGIVKLHVYMTPPSPAQEIDFSLEYDVSYLEEAFA